MKILFLCHKIPYPPNRGDRIPTFYRLRFLSKRHKIHLAFPCFNIQELKYLDVLQEYAVSVDTVLIRPFWAKLKALCYIFSRFPLTLPYFYSKCLHKKILSRIQEEKIDLIYVYSSSMGQYVFDIKGIKKIMDLADSDAHKWLQYAKHTLPPVSFIYYLEWLKLKRYEGRLTKTFDHAIAISEDEKSLFTTYIKDVEMSVIPNGVNLEYFRLSQEEYEPKHLVFVGAMDYYANVDGVVYFYKRIFPFVRKEVPDVKFYVVGSRPTKSVIRLGKDKDVIVTGFVNDVRPYLRKAAVFVVPLRIARGMQNKILEAMASGVPVVTTSKGNEGINAVNGEHILVEDEPRKFAESVVRLMQDRALRNKIASAGREFVERNHNWGRNLAKLENILVKVHGS